MKAWLWAMVVLVFGIFGAMHWTDRRLQAYSREAKARESILQARLAEAETSRKTDSVEVVRTVTRTKTLRDSVMVNKTDTLLVERLVYATDTLRIACTRCTESAARLKVSYDSIVAKRDSTIRLLRPSKWDRIKPFVYAGAGFYVGAKLRVP